MDQWFKRLTHLSGRATNESHGKFPHDNDEGRNSKYDRYGENDSGSEEYDDSNLEPEEYDEYALH